MVEYTFSPKDLGLLMISNNHTVIVNKYDICMFIFCFVCYRLLSTLLCLTNGWLHVQSPRESSGSWDHLIQDHKYMISLL